MPTQGANFLGTIGSGGVMGAFEGIQKLIDEARARAEHAEKMKEAEFSRGFRDRTLGETTRSNVANEGIAGRHASVAEGRLATDRDYFGLASKRDTRDEAEYQRKLKAIEGLTQRNPGAVGDSILGKSVGINVDSDEFRTPEDIGKRKGGASLAEWLGGLQTVKQGETDMGNKSALSLLAERGKQDMQLAGEHGRQARLTQLERPKPGADPNAPMSALARQVYDDPLLLEKMTKKDATAIMAELANAAERGDVEGVPNPARVKGDVLRQEALASLKELRNHPGFKGAFGMPDPASPGSWTRATQLIPGMPGYAVPFTAAANAAAIRRNVAAKLVQPKLEVMRGLGAMNKQEFENVQASASIVNDRFIDDATALKEIDKMIAQLEAAQARADAGGRAPKPAGKSPEEQAKEDAAFLRSRGGG